MLSEAVDTVSQSFVGRSPIGIWLERTEEGYRAVFEETIAGCVGNGLCTVARDDSTGRMLGVCLAEDLADTKPPLSFEAAQSALLDDKSKVFPLLVGRMYWFDRERHGLRESVPRGVHLHVAIMAVREEAAGRNLCRSLVQKALETAHERGFTRAVADTSGERALHILRKLGFDEVYRYDWSSLDIRPPMPPLEKLPDKGQALVERALGGVEA